MARSPTCKRVSDMGIDSFRIGKERVVATYELLTTHTNMRVQQMHAPHVIGTKKCYNAQVRPCTNLHHLRESHRMEHKL